MQKTSRKSLIVIFSAIFCIFLTSFLLGYFLLSVFGLVWLKVAVGLLISGIASFIVAYGILVFEPVAKEVISSLNRLHRVENFSHPLLLKLSYEAPGTFHHSINVSILAQKAAKAIGADALLVRIAAYYHDIGKLKEPLSYIENQSGEEIPRSEDMDSIRRNANKIIGHVNSGLEIAQRYHLPEDIINLISEHHGTTRALYFYEKAKEKGLKIKKTDFRYEGPAPQSKEAAILMLADSVEAAARALPDLSPDRLRAVIEFTMEDKIGENQFKNSGLLEGDLAKIKDALTQTLTSIYHQRIIKENAEH